MTTKRTDWSTFTLDDLINAVRAGTPNAKAAARRRIAAVRSEEARRSFERQLADAADKARDDAR